MTAAKTHLSSLRNLYTVKMNAVILKGKPHGDFFETWVAIFLYMPYGREVCCIWKPYVSDIGDIFFVEIALTKIFYRPIKLRFVHFELKLMKIWNLKNQNFKNKKMKKIYFKFFQKWVLTHSNEWYEFKLTQKHCSNGICDNLDHNRWCGIMHDKFEKIQTFRFFCLMFECFPRLLHVFKFIVHANLPQCICYDSDCHIWNFDNMYMLINPRNIHWMCKNSLFANFEIL